ncbi:capsule biosynthesis protein [Ensifer sesbaniae]|uniref:capsule biosynthesis protein n=1 Tax=Ensifer sesbaniae TaxID=1214071 RepID=UPI00200176C9|nr:capsule biosynthesis protein [Ensifer sesbaniae]
MTRERTEEKKIAPSGFRERLAEIQAKTGAPIAKRILRNAGALRLPPTNVIDVQPDSTDTGDVTQSGSSVKTSGKMPIALVTYIAFVIVPFIASAIYFAFVASDQFVAEARFAVRSLTENRDGESVDGSVLSMSSMSQDGYVVTSFIHSTEILNRLASRIDYRAIFARTDVDFLSRFEPDRSNERFLKYWDNQVATFVDGPSGIITLKTRTFSPEDSKQLASVIIDESEKLINELSDRVQRDVTERFADEVKRATENYQKTLIALKNFQNTTGILTPEARATEAGSLLAGLLSRKLELDTRLFVLKESDAESSPARQQLVFASRGLEAQIDKLRAELAGNTSADENIASAITSFAALETDRRVAENLYEVARRNLETAQAEAMRKALYIVVFVPPTVPQESLYPHRLSSPLLLLLALSVAWATFALIWASVEDHKL